MRALPYNNSSSFLIESHMKEMPTEFNKAHAIIHKAVKLYKEGKRFEIK